MIFNIFFIKFFLILFNALCLSLFSLFCAQKLIQSTSLTTYDIVKINKISYSTFFIIASTIFTCMHIHYMPNYHLFLKIIYLYFIFNISVAMHTDNQVMLISRYTSLYVAIIGLLSSYFNNSFINFSSSYYGALFGGILLWTINYLFKKIKNIDGLGQGDIDLSIMIGSFLGIIGFWHTLTIGSTIGSIYGVYQLRTNTHNTTLKLPFGLYLGYGAYCTLIFYNKMI